jgi:hypothetical protein
MTQPIISLRIRQSRDTLRARQRARQIAGLLGYQGLERSMISAKVFALALRALEKANGAKMLFRLIGDRLQVVCQYLPGQSGNLPSGCGKKCARLAFPPPQQPRQLEASDLPWLARELGRMTPLDPAEEVKLLRQELSLLLPYAGVNSPSGHHHENAA